MEELYYDFFYRVPPIMINAAVKIFVAIGF